MKLFSRIRKAIREYTGTPGMAFETYSRAFFMKQNALTIYVTKRNKIYVPKALMRFLFDENPDLISDYTFLHMKTFDDNRDDWVPGQRSRIGDAIAVFTGADLLSKIAKYNEDHVFRLSKRWHITIKGGQRNSDVTDASPQLPTTSNFARQLIQNLSAEAANAASAGSNPVDDK